MHATASLQYTNAHYSYQYTMCSLHAAIVHGDFRIDNIVFHPTEPRVIAVLDWELCTIGHPLADVAFLVVFSFIFPVSTKMSEWWQYDVTVTSSPAVAVTVTSSPAVGSHCDIIFRNDVVWPAVIRGGLFFPQLDLRFQMYLGFLVCMSLPGYMWLL